MEKIERENKTLKIVIVLLVIALLGLGAYHFFGNYINVDKEGEGKVVSENVNKNVVTAEVKSILSQRKSILSISGTDSTSFLSFSQKESNLKCGSLNSKQDPISVMIDTNGDSYLIVDCSKGENLDTTPRDEETNEFIKILEEKNNIKFEKYDVYSHGKAYKLPISNVSIAYNMYFMTGGGYYFVFVLNDGRVAAMTDNEIISSGEINTKIFDDLNNIVYITDCGMNGANCEPFAVNTNGEEIYLLTYFREWFGEYRK